MRVVEPSWPEGKLLVKEPRVSCTAARGAAVARLDHLVGAGKCVGGTSGPSAFATIRRRAAEVDEGHRPTGVENSYFS
jgi:hypothetical protein